MREILIFGPVGDYWGEDDVRPSRILAEIKAAGDEPILVRINSPGGDCFDGMSIYSALAAIRDRVTVRVEGLAASIASVIALAGGKIEMTDVSFFMVHCASTFAFGCADELATQVSLLRQLDKTISGVYASRSGTAESWLQMMGEETWLDSEQALTAKLVDVVIKTAVGKPDAALLGRYAAMARAFSLAAAKRRSHTMAGSKATVEAVVGTCTLPSGETAQSDEAFCTAAGGTWEAPATGDGEANVETTAAVTVASPVAASVAEIDAAAPTATPEQKLKWVREQKTLEQVRAENVARIESENVELRKQISARKTAPVVAAVRAPAAVAVEEDENSDEALKREWDSDPDIRAEYRKFASFVAYRKNAHRITYTRKVPNGK